MKELKKNKSQKKLVLHKETLKTLKVKTHVKTGLPPRMASGLPETCKTCCDAGTTC